MPLKIVRNDITKMNTEAIVNIANSVVGVGAGCDYAIHTAAGMNELLEYRNSNIGEVEPGNAFITPGFKLTARYIIHVVSPLYVDGNHGEEDLLRKCYKNALNLALQNNISSIAFPLVSTGSFGYPKEEGLRIAIDEINAFIDNRDIEVFIVVFGDSMYNAGKRVFPDLDSYIDSKYVDEAVQFEYNNEFSLSCESEEYQPRNSSLMMAPQMMAEPMMAPQASFENDRAKAKDKTKKGAEKPKQNLFARLRDKGSKAVSSKSEPVSYEETAPNDFGTMSYGMASSISYDVPDYEKLEAELAERIKHMTDTFSEYLLYLIELKGMTNAEVYKRAVVDKKVFSKIKNDMNYHPQKLTVLCLCIGARLNIDESTDLLKRAGYALSPCSKTDLIFSYFIENKIYDMIELDIQLEEHGLPCIIT